MILSKRKLLLPIIVIALTILFVGLVMSCGPNGTTKDTKTESTSTSTSTSTLVSQEFRFMNSMVTDSFFYNDIAAPTFLLYDKDFNSGEKYDLTYTEFTLAKTAIPEDTANLDAANILEQSTTEATKSVEAVQLSDDDQEFIGLPFKLTDFVADGGVTTKTALDTLLQGVTKVYYKIVVKEFRKTQEFDGTNVSETLSAYTNKTISGSVTVDRAGNIYNEYDLKAITKDLAGDYTFQRDIKISLTSAWNSFGVFTGTLNGNGKTIKIATDGTSHEMNGLFSSIESSATDADIQDGSSVSVKDLTIDVLNDIDNSKGISGILAGDLKKGAIKNVTLTSSNYDDADISNDVKLNMTSGININRARGGLIGRILSEGVVVMDNIKVNLDLNVNLTIQDIGGIVGQISTASSSDATHTITLTNLEYVGSIKRVTSNIMSAAGGLVGYASPPIATGNVRLLTITGKVGGATRSTEILANSQVGAAVGYLKNASLDVEVGNVDVRATDPDSKVGGAIGIADNVVATAKIGNLGSVFISGQLHVGGVVSQALAVSTITGQVDATGTADGLVQIVSLYTTNASDIRVGGIAGYADGGSTVQGYVKFRNAAYDANNPIASTAPTATDANLTELDKGGIVIKGGTTNQRVSVGGLVGYATGGSNVYGHADVRISAPYVKYLGGLVGNTGGEATNIVKVVGYVSGTIYSLVPSGQENIGGVIGFRGVAEAAAVVNAYAKDLVIDARHIASEPAIGLVLGRYFGTEPSTNFRAFAINSKILYAESLTEKTNRVVDIWTESTVYKLSSIGAYVYASSATASNDGGNIKITGPNVNDSDTEVSFTYSGMTVGSNVGEWVVATPPQLAGGTDIFGTQ